MIRMELIQDGNIVYLITQSGVRAFELYGEGLPLDLQRALEYQLWIRPQQSEDGNE